MINGPSLPYHELKHRFCSLEHRGVFREVCVGDIFEDERCRAVVARPQRVLHVGEES